MENKLLSRRVLSIIVTTLFCVAIFQTVLVTNINAAEEFGAIAKPESAHGSIYGNLKIDYKTEGDISIDPKEVPVKKKVVVLMDASINVVSPTKSPFEYAIFTDGDFKASNQKVTIKGDVRTNSSAEVAADDFKIVTTLDKDGNTIGGFLEYFNDIKKNVGNVNFTPAKVNEQLEIDTGLAAKYLNNNSSDYNIITIGKETSGDYLKKLGCNLTLKQSNNILELNNGIDGDFQLDCAYKNGKLNVWCFDPGVKISISGQIKGKGIIISNGELITQGSGIDGEIMLYSLGGNISVEANSNTKNSAIVYAPHGNVTLLGQQFTMDGSIIGQKVIVNPDTVEITWKKFLDLKPPEEPKIPENIIKAAEDFVEKIDNKNVSINFIPFRQNANDNRGDAGYINPTDYSEGDTENGDVKLKDTIKGVTSSSKNPAHTYANLGDGLRRAYYILEKYPIYSKSVVVLSNGIIKGWTQSDNNEDVAMPPYKTFSGGAKSYGKKPESDDADKSFKYAEHFLMKLKSADINTYMVQLNNLDKIGIEKSQLEKLVDAVEGIPGGETKYLPDKNSVPDGLTKSINKYDTKKVERIYLERMEINEEYPDGIQIQGFKYDDPKTSGWIKKSDTSFSGNYKGRLGRIDINKKDDKFSIGPESVAVTVGFKKQGSIDVKTDLDKRKVTYKYVFMEKDHFIDNEGNDLGKDIGTVRSNAFMSGEVPLNSFNITVNVYSDKNRPKDPVISIEDMIVGDVAYVKLNLGTHCVVNPKLYNPDIKSIKPIDPDFQPYGDVYEITKWQIRDKDKNGKPIKIESKKNGSEVILSCKYIDLIYDTKEPRVCKIIAKSKSNDVNIIVMGNRLDSSTYTVVNDPIQDDVDFNIISDIH